MGPPTAERDHEARAEDDGESRRESEQRLK
jgi:hypothetical protein